MSEGVPPASGITVPNVAVDVVVWARREPQKANHRTAQMRQNLRFLKMRISPGRHGS